LNIISSPFDPLAPFKMRVQVSKVGHLNPAKPK
jgi:hypothetical protein